jgi:glucuronoarabinoxylan endo-1,4-beta-xylanase
MSGYIWWKTIGNANGLLDASGVLQRRAYVMAQFSRFVRPGDLRIGVTANSSPLGISAFENQYRNQITIVAVNNTIAPVTHTFNLQGIVTPSVAPVITSATRSLETQSPVVVSGNAFTYTIPATSVVTFVTAPPISVSAGGFVYNRRTGLVVQQVTLINSTASTIAGPICFAFDSLSSNTSLTNAAGTTVNPPVGSPFVIASSGDMAPGATLNVSLQFTLPSSGSITYAARTVTGTATP